MLSLANACVANLTRCADVVKSRVQLRATPPTGTPVQYIAHELKAIVSEGGWSVSYTSDGTLSLLTSLPRRIGLFRGLSPSRASPYRYHLRASAD